MYFTLADAATKVGMSRSSIYRLIDEGKLSSTTDRRGKKVIELTELLRVFGSIQESTGQEDIQEHNKHNPVRQTEHTGRTGQDTLFSTVQELEKLRYQLQIQDMELKLKDKELELVAERMNDLKLANAQVHQEKSKLLEIIERQSLMLAAPAPKKSSTTVQTKSIKTTATAKKVPKKPPAKRTEPVKAAVTKRPTKPVLTVKSKPIKSSK